MLLLVVCGVFAIVALVSALQPSWLHGGERARVFLPDGQGVQRGDPVTYLGIHVGRVNGIAFERGQVLLELDIRADVPLRSRDSVRIESAGLVGGQTVRIVPGPPTAAPLPQGGLLMAASQEKPQVLGPAELLKAIAECRGDTGVAARDSSRRVPGRGTVHDTGAVR